MKTVAIYHNNRCSKSRQALTLLEQENVDVNVIEYLKEPLSEDSLTELLISLNMRPIDLMRKGEQDYKDYVKGTNLEDGALIKLMVQYPKLIERPILVSKDRAIIARPPELVHEFVKTI
ncbi:MAG: arsenate reductase (glutaredoxin) [Crocinitomicaceae bacterium]|nr:arsenate reductase (glutaredoxin) [Crocinitomicaceae bacterium]